jgi:prepilin-type N-terminal cleavage/methylation domain-containing protein
MLARIRQSAKTENDKGFTLIELLVVMIIIGILAAIAIPVFLNQRKKAEDTATKSDVTTIGKEIATYYVDNTASPGASALAITGGNWTFPNTTTVIGRISRPATTTILNQKYTSPTAWCVALTDSAGSTPIWKYSAANGLVGGADCVSGTDY